MCRILFLVLLCAVVGCSKKQVIDKGFHAPQTLSVTGDFNGDGITENLNQDIVDSTGTVITQIPDMPAEIENDTTTDSWYNYIDFYARLNYRTRVKALGVKNGPLLFGNSQGLYCLINVGNVNDNPGDEIALVIDRLDFSRSNSCTIYSLCNGIWEACFQYYVHEDAFDYNGKAMPAFHEIKGALEFQQGLWKYYDYMDMPYERAEDVGHFLPLQASSCSK